MPTLIAPNPTRQRMTPSALEAMIVSLVSAASRPDPARPGAARPPHSATLPIDSLLAVEILCDLEDALGVRLPDDKLTADSLRSARSLAVRVSEMAVEVGTTSPE